MRTVTAGHHTGYLIDREKGEQEFVEKAGIAAGIARTIMGEFK